MLESMLSEYRYNGFQQLGVQEYFKQFGIKILYKYYFCALKTINTGRCIFWKWMFHYIKRCLPNITFIQSTWIIIMYNIRNVNFGTSQYQVHPRALLIIYSHRSNVNAFTNQQSDFQPIKHWSHPSILPATKWLQYQDCTNTFWALTHFGLMQ